MFFGKLHSAVWFLRRPQLFPQFVHLVGQRIFGGRVPDTRKQSERWCERRAIGIQDAITRLTGAKMELSLTERHADVFAEARARVESCPVKMGGPGALDLLYWTILRKNSQRAVETGVAYGWSSLAILLAQQEIAGARLISIDMPYLRANNDAYVGIAIPDRLKIRGCWELIRRSDRQALPGALKRLGNIDFCHYDSDKTYVGRMWAYPRLWRALVDGGLFISDDIGDDVGFRDFSERVGAEPMVVRIDQEGGPKYVGILVKPASAK